MLGIDTRELDATSTELSFVLGGKGTKGGRACSRSPWIACDVHHLRYLRLKECCRKFWTVINSGVEDAYIKFYRKT